MSEEWKKEFFEWKDQIESKYNDLSESKIKCENKIEVLEGKLSEWNEIMNISIKGNIDERIMSLKKITDAQVIVNEYHSKGFNRLEKVLRELNELIRGLVSDLQDSNSLSKATGKCYEGKLIKNLEKLDSTKKKFPSDSQEFWDNLDKNLVKQKALGGEKEVVSTALRGDQKAESGGSVLPSNSKPSKSKEIFIPEREDLSRFKNSDNEKLPEFICTLKEQDDCDEECSMECLKGNSEGDRFESGSCVHGKKELEQNTKGG